MPLRLPFALLATAIGLVGLILNMSVIAGVMGPPQNRPFWNFLIYYWSFLTNLSNTALLLIYVADLTGARALGWLHNPVFRTGMAGIMILVMFFYHFMLAPTLPDMADAIEISNILLHYVTPIMFLVWWTVWSPHGTLRYRTLPLMLVPGLLYVTYIEIRGALAGEYPYLILDPRAVDHSDPLGGPLTVAISVAILIVLVAAFDLLLIFIDGLLARRRQPAREAT